MKEDEKALQQFQKENPEIPVFKLGKNLHGQLDEALGRHDHSMRRDRPYDGQSWTHSGIRGKEEIRSVTFRDLRDCYIRAILLSDPDLPPTVYGEVAKGEHAVLSEADLDMVDFTKVDHMAIFQNLVCEVEKQMGIFPNVAGMRPTEAKEKK